MNFLRFTMEIGAGDAVPVAMETGAGGGDTAIDSDTMTDADAGEAESVLHEQTRQPASSSFEGLAANMVALQGGFSSVKCVCFSQEANMAHGIGGPLHYATCGAAGIVVRSYESGQLVEPTNDAPAKAPSGKTIVSAAFTRQVPPGLLAVTTDGDVVEFGAGAPKKREEFQNMHA